MLTSCLFQALADTEEILKFLGGMRKWLDGLYSSLDPEQLVRLFPPLTHTLLLVWTHSV